MKKFISFLLVCTLIFGTVATVSAADNTASASIENCIKINDSGHLYLANNILAMGFTDEQINVMNDVIASYNDMIDSGYYILNSVTEVVPTEKYYEEIAPQARGGGITNAIPISGTTWQIWLSDEACDMVATGMDLGGVFAALITNPAVAVLVSAACVIYSNAISNTNEGNGVMFKLTMPTPILYDFQPQ